MPAPHSLEEKHDQRTAAQRVLQEMKERELQILNTGARYVKGPNRSYILKKLRTHKS